LRFGKQFLGSPFPPEADSAARRIRRWTDSPLAKEARFLVRAQAGQFTSETSCPRAGEKGAPLTNITDVMFAGAGGRPGPADFSRGRAPSLRRRTNRPGSFTDVKLLRCDGSGKAVYRAAVS
jgi:hypothetical protein